VIASDSRIYVGRLDNRGPSVYAIGATSVERLVPLAGRLRWGRNGDEVVELARVLLTDAAGSEPPRDACRQFGEQILARLPQDGFALERDTVNAWLQRVVTV
jgi:hypothetical protein